MKLIFRRHWDGAHTGFVFRAIRCPGGSAGTFGQYYNE